MDDYDDLIRRLKDLGARPVDPGLAAKCLNVMRTHPRRRLNLTKFKVATAAVAGFLVGSVGLASAGTLPAPAQGVAHSVLKTVGVNVLPGHDRYNDPAVCPGGPYRNHGAYVRSHKDDPNAGASPCGKPARSVQGGDDSATEPREAPGNGPPPWAHGGGKGPKPGKGEKSEEPGAAPTPTTAAPIAPTTTSAPPPTTVPTAAPTTTTAPSTTTTSQP